MYKNFKKFLTIFMVSLMWTQFGYAPEEETSDISKILDAQAQNKAALRADLRESRRQNFINRMNIEHNLTDQSSDDDINKAYRAETRSYYQGKGLFNAKSKEESAYSIDNLEDYRTAHLREVQAARKTRQASREAALRGQDVSLKRKLNDEELTSINSIQAFEQLSEKQKEQFITWVINKIDLTKSLSEQSVDLLSKIRTIPDTGKFGEDLTNKIQSLDQKELISINSAYFIFVKPDQVKEFTPETINELSNKQLTELIKKEENKTTLKQRIQSFTPEELVNLEKYFNYITTEQVKSLLRRPALVSALSPEQVQAINKEELVKVIKGEASVLGKKWLGKNNLPQSFVDALTPEQAKAILDSKGFMTDHNYFFSNLQIKMLENKAKAANSDISANVAQAQNFVRKLIANNFTSTPRDRREFELTIGKLSTKELESVANEFTGVIDEKEAEFLGKYRHKKEIAELKKSIDTFIADYINPSLKPSEWAMKLFNQKTGHNSIEIIDMNKINPTESIADQYERLKSTDILTRHRDGYINPNDLAKEYGRWFVAKKIDLTQSFKSQTNEFAPDITTSIETLLRNKINNGLQDGSIKIENLDPSYFGYINDDTFEQFSTEQYKNMENKILNLTPDELTVILEKSKVEKIKEGIRTLLKEKFINNPSSFGKTSLSRIDNSFIDTLSNEELSKLENNLSKLSEDQLRTILRNTESSELREAIYRLKPSLDTVAVRPDTTQTALIIDPRIDQAISTQQRLVLTLTRENASQLVPRITDLSNQTTEDLSAALVKIDQQRNANIATINKYLKQNNLPEISQNPTEDEIRKTVKRLALIYNPDNGTNPDSTIMATVNSTRDLLIEDLPQEAAAIADRTLEEQKLLTDVQNKAVEVTAPITMKEIVANLARNQVLFNQATSFYTGLTGKTYIPKPIIVNPSRGIASNPLATTDRSPLSTKLMTKTNDPLAQAGNRQGQGMLGFTRKQ